MKGSFFSAAGSVSAPDAVSAALAGKPWLPPLPAAAWHQITDPCERTRLAAEPVDGPAARFRKSVVPQCVNDSSGLPIIPLIRGSCGFPNVLELVRRA
jgi:hypothetical protein